eukprot:7256399-Prymnesium_polylepis.1
MVALAMPAPPKRWGRRAWRSGWGSARTRSGRGEQPAPASDSNEWATRASTKAAIDGCCSMPWAAHHG